VTLKVLRALVFVLVLSSLLAGAYLQARVSTLELEVSNLERSRGDLEMAVDEVRAHLDLAQGNVEKLRARIEVYRRTGQFPTVLNETVYPDGRIHLLYLYYTFCASCEVDHAKNFTARLPRWVGNVSSEFYVAEIFNIAEDPGRSEAQRIFGAMGLSEEYFSRDWVVEVGGNESFIFPLSVDDESVAFATRYLYVSMFWNLGLKYLNSKAASVSLNSVEEAPSAMSGVVVVFLGFVSGFNPCLIALVSFILAATLKLEGGYLKALRRAFITALGVLYAYLLMGFSTFSIPNLATYVSWLTLPLGVSLLILGALNLVELSHDVYSGRWKRGEEARLQLFRTPEFLKRMIVETAYRDNFYLDFGIGGLFSLIKLPCIGPLFLILFTSTPTQPVESLLNVVLFTVGVVLPIFVATSLVGLGVMKTSHMTALRFKGRLVQRGVVGILLLVSGSVVLFQEAIWALLAARP